MNMFEANAESTYPTLPTLRKFCKENPFSAEKGVKIVNFVWLPNQYESVTFDTDCFRHRISNSADFYEELLRELEKWEKESACIGIRITSAEKCAYQLFSLEGENADWKKVGEFGRKLTVRDRRERKKNVRSQNPLSLDSDRTRAQAEWPLEGP